MTLAVTLALNGGALASVRWADQEFLAPAFSLANGGGVMDLVGWQTMFPNAGHGCSVGGELYPDHGHAFAAYWASEGRESAFRHGDLIIRRTVSVGDSVTIEDTISCEGGVESVFSYGHHILFDAKPDSVVTGVGDPIRLVDQLGANAEWFAVRHGAGRAELAHTDGSGVLLEWDATVMSWIWLWLRVFDEPEQGGAQRLVVGLEPVSTSRFEGLAAAVESREALVLVSQQHLSTWIRLTPAPRTNIL